MVKKCPVIANNNACLIWSVCGKINCYRKPHKGPNLEFSSDPASIKSKNSRSQVGFIHKKQLIIDNKKERMHLIRKMCTSKGNVLKKSKGMTGPRRANRMAYLAGKNFLFSRNLAKAARVKASLKFCADNKVKKRNSKTAAT